jgi:hypothetical protein
MVSTQSVDKQLKRLGFKKHGWGQHEVGELHNILLPDEEIHELVNGFYEGGFALLVATDVRVLLVDKKPLNYLTVEDLRFDMINEMDYSHRLLGAQINIATGNKTLKFSSLNQQRLRKLIGHVQHSMAEIKKKAHSHQEDQKTHLQQINQQLQAYLVAQHQHQIQLQQFQQAQASGQAAPPPPEPVKPSPELSDFLYAQSLLAQHQALTGQQDLPLQPEILNQVQVAPQQQALPPPQPVMEPTPMTAPQTELQATPSMNELYADGMQEIFGKREQQAATTEAPAQPTAAPVPSATTHHPLEVNPMRIAASKLPMALRNRKFGRPSFHAHSQQQEEPLLPPQPAEA